MAGGSDADDRRTVRALAAPGGRREPHDSPPRVDRPALCRAPLGATPRPLGAPRGNLMLAVREVTRHYGSLVALDHVSFEVEPGEVVGLLGANGAGKSTLLRTAAGLQPPDEGSVQVQGIDVWNEPQDAKRRLGYAAEEPSFYEELSADEYLAFIATLRALDPASSRRRAHELLERLGLTGRIDEPVQQFSHGMRKKLSFVAAVLHRPPVLLCDEALDGFDAAGAFAAKTELAALAREGAAILFSSHVTETIERVCDRAVLLHEGRVARMLPRAAWGDPAPGPSPLEREFLAVAGGSP
ncbi:MAG: ABC transporter ATP-binding protein [Candidatus Eisenbacteria bacterium]|uniref:ABC transporter ATP-binding protein n=1 Tax=Eiseniibacteriota bacterium TaxID=2212470 RepID=A0A538U5Z2_UNCEI|nr:MAG: ABC transporter ATP-binding protein [Candidatus Eisenbacteria bacterium]